MIGFSGAVMYNCYYYLAGLYTQHGGGEGKIWPSVNALELKLESINIVGTLSYRYPIVEILLLCFFSFCPSFELAELSSVGMFVAVGGIRCNADKLPIKIS